MDLGVMSTMAEGGPMITGQWINQKTGEQVTVRDSYIDGDDMYIMLTNGKQLTLSEFQDYVQMSEETYDERGNNLGTQPQTSFREAKKGDTNKKKPTYDPNLVFDGIDTNKKTSVQGMSDLQKQILADEAASLGLNTDDTDDTIITVSDEPTVQHKVIQPFDEASEKEQMIMKILEKTENPKISFNVSWEGYPNKELKMLKEYFNISNEDISKAIIKKYVTRNEIEKIVTEWIEKEQL